MGRLLVALLVLLFTPIRLASRPPAEGYAFNRFGPLQWMAHRHFHIPGWETEWRLCNWQLRVGSHQVTLWHNHAFAFWWYARRGWTFSDGHKYLGYSWQGLLGRLPVSTAPTG